MNKPSFSLVIGEYSHGRAIRCPLPSHNDNKPSAVIYDNSKGEYLVCFGCGFKGDIYNYIGETQFLTTYKEQVKFLKDKYGL